MSQLLYLASLGHCSVTNQACSQIHFAISGYNRFKPVANAARDGAEIATGGAEG